MTAPEVPADLKYTEQHEWVRAEGGTATFGITDFAQNALGEVTYVELPEPGTDLARDKEFAVVESLKAASDVYAPVSGKVAEVNAALDADPKKINDDPYGEGWLCKVDGVDQAELGCLLSHEQYAELIAKEENQA